LVRADPADQGNLQPALADLHGDSPARRRSAACLGELGYDRLRQARTAVRHQLAQELLRFRRAPAEAAIAVRCDQEPPGRIECRMRAVRDSRVGKMDANAGKQLIDDDGLRHVVDAARSEEHTSELQSREKLVCRLLLEKKKKWTEGPRGSCWPKTSGKGTAGLCCSRPTCTAVAAVWRFIAGAAGAALYPMLPAVPVDSP